MTFKIVTDRDFVTRCAHALTCIDLSDAQKLWIIKAAYQEMVFPEHPISDAQKWLIKHIYKEKEANK